MKVLFPFVGDSVGGSHLSSLELCTLLQERGYDVVILLHRKDGPLAGLLINQNIPFQTIQPRRLAGENGSFLSILVGVLWNLAPLIRFIVSNKIDIVHGNDLRVNLTWSVASRLSGRRFIWHQRTVMSTSALWMCVSVLCGHFVGISKAVMDSAPRTLPASRKSLVYNAVSVSSLSSAKESKHFLQKDLTHFDGQLLGYVGRLVDYKNVDFVINAVGHLIKKCGKQVKLLVVGNGVDTYVEYLKATIKELDIEDSVFLLGYVENPLRIIEELDILIASSSIDAFGRTIVEAMLLGTPVLAADKGGHLELVENNYNGLLFEANNQDSFVENALKLLDNRELRETFVKQAQSSSYARFSSRKNFEAIDEIYRGPF